MAPQGDPTRYVDIRTKRGREIYDDAMDRAGRLQEKLGSVKGSARKELEDEIARVQNEGKKKAIALNPKPKPKKKAAVNKIRISRVRRR